MSIRGGKKRKHIYVLRYENSKSNFGQDDKGLNTHSKSTGHVESHEKVKLAVSEITNLGIITLTLCKASFYSPWEKRKEENRVRQSNTWEHKRISMMNGERKKLKKAKMSCELPTKGRKLWSPGTARLRQQRGFWEKPGGQNYRHKRWRCRKMHRACGRKGTMSQDMDK